MGQLIGALYLEFLPACVGAAVSVTHTVYSCFSVGFICAELLPFHVVFVHQHVGLKSTLGVTTCVFVWPVLAAQSQLRIQPAREYFLSGVLLTKLIQNVVFI